jgi:PAS domain S-box-containing protein
LSKLMKSPDMNREIPEISKKPGIQIDVQAILDAFPFYVMLVDSEHQIIMANKAVFSKLDMKSRDIIGQYCPMVVHGTEEPFPGCPLEEAADKDAGVERELYDEKTGYWVSSAVYPTSLFAENGRRLFLHMVSDVTERKKVQESLVAAHIQLQNLASHMESIREEEKKKIARDLHDDTSQVLSSIYAQLEAAIVILPKEAHEVRNLIKRVQDLSTIALDEIHKIIFELRPSILDRLGLMAAVNSLLEQSKKEGLKVSFKITGREIRLTPEKEIEVYRIIQEALNNIKKHAEAHQIELSVNFRKNDLHIKIKDDGKGFEVQNALNSKEATRGWGLIGMTERAKLLDGTIKFNSMIQRGTSIEVVIPLGRCVNHG